MSSHYHPGYYAGEAFGKALAKHIDAIRREVQLHLNGDITYRAQWVHGFKDAMREAVNKVK